MSESKQYSSRPFSRGGVSRREIARGAKWAAPTIVVGAAAPALAASPTALTPCTQSAMVYQGLGFQTTLKSVDGVSSDETAPSSTLFSDATFYPATNNTNLAFVRAATNEMGDTYGLSTFSIYSSAAPSYSADGILTVPVSFQISSHFALAAGMSIDINFGAMAQPRATWSDSGSANAPLEFQLDTVMQNQTLDTDNLHGQTADGTMITTPGTSSLTSNISGKSVHVVLNESFSADTWYAFTINVDINVGDDFSSLGDATVVGWSRIFIPISSAVANYVVTDVIPAGEASLAAPFKFIESILIADAQADIGTLPCV